MDLLNRKRLRAQRTEIAALRARNAELRKMLDERAKLAALEHYAHHLAAALAQRDYVLATNVIVPPDVAAAHGLTTRH